MFKLNRKITDLNGSITYDVFSYHIAVVVDSKAVFINTWSNRVFQCNKLDVKMGKDRLQNY